MIVKLMKDSEDSSFSSDIQKLKLLSPSEFAMDSGDETPRGFIKTKKPDWREIDDRWLSGKYIKSFMELDSKQEDEGFSSSEVESPTFVTEFKNGEKNIDFVHHQVLKIKEEDSHLGEDIGEGLNTRDKLAVLHLTSQLDTLILSRPILPCSPLSGKTGIKSFH